MVGEIDAGAGALLAIGFSLTYLLFPLIHHLLATPPDYKYISTSSNFFGFSLGIQMLTCAIAALVTVLITQGNRIYYVK